MMPSIDNLNLQISGGVRPEGNSISEELSPDPALVGHVARLTQILPGLDDQDQEALTNRLLTRSAVMASRRLPNGEIQFVGYQSLPKKYDPSTRSELAMILGIYDKYLPGLEIREWSSGVTDEEIQGQGINTFLKETLLGQAQDDKNGWPQLMMVEVFNFSAAALAVNIRKNGMIPIDSLELPFAAEFLAHLPFQRGLGKKNLINPPRRLVGEELSGLVGRIKAGERITEEEVELLQTGKAEVLMVSKVDGDDGALALNGALLEMAGKVNINKKRELTKYLETQFPNVYNAIIARYSDTFDKETVQNILVLVGGLRRLAILQTA